MFAPGRLGAVVSVIAIAFSACAAVPREGSTSDLVRFAYFSKSSGGDGGALNMGGTGFPAPTKQFDADKDAVYFVFDVRFPAKRDLPARWQLFRPDGLLERENDLRLEYLGGSVSSWMAVPMPIASLKAFPGTWRTVLFVEAREVGRYEFTFGDARTVARAQESFRQAAAAAARMLAPAPDGPRVRLDITALAGATVQITEKNTTIASSVIDRADGRYSIELPVGVYVVEVTKADFEPWRETVTLRVTEQGVQRTAKLVPRAR